MLVTIDITAEARRKIARDQQLAAQVDGAMAKAMEHTVAVGADEIAVMVKTGEVGLRSDTAAASLMGWMINPSTPTGAIGVPANTPAAAWARIQEEGGTIYPKRAKALAVPISDEAKGYSSPRDMPDLQLIPRKGKPPLLVRELSKRGDVIGFELHWVLVPSVTILATHWLSRGAKRAAPEMRDAFRERLGEYLEKW